MPGTASKTDPDHQIFDLRMQRSHLDLWGMLQRLYGQRPDFSSFCNALTKSLARNWAERPADLKLLDLKRDLEPDWFQRPDMAGYVFYVDRFNGNLKGVLEKIDYLQDLGITYIHFMACLKPRSGDSDGGSSVMDYRAINPEYGTMADFESVAKALRGRGFSICVDLVLNHTAKEHDWAKKARAGVTKYQDYYLMFDDDTLPQQYEKSLVEVFPNNAPGNFNYYPDFGKWVWTTFNEHQWDLNWANPWVFLEIVEIMLNLANKGVDVVRLDAVAFMWKRVGTRSQSEPEVHDILHALRAASRIAAPSVIHLAEAIVAPAEMIPYLGQAQHDGKVGNLAYHNSLMVQFWSALATRETKLMSFVLKTHFPPVFTNATFATYIRCHDDIGWAITDEDGHAVGINGAKHRAFLSEFFEGGFIGSFAKGEVFQYNLETGDKRISGSFASLAGLEMAEREEDRSGIEMAIQRILLGHALIASFGGIPLIYMGDELALTNDYSYIADPHRAHDSRWLHRPQMDWAKASNRATANTTSARVYQGVRDILARRRHLPQLHGAHPTRIVESGQSGVFAFVRCAPVGPLVCIFNFTENWSGLPSSWARLQGATRFEDALSGQSVALHADKIILPPYARLWLV